MTANGGEA
ncbi:Putative uncharacterized protein [Lacticaseibacillus paracasei]|nr:Putative uncharacterized protein [Lacticaseibacillus paracasei]